MKNSFNKKVNRYHYDDINFDSQEEIDFYKFLKISKKLGIFIKDFEYQPKSFVLIPKATYVDQVKLKTKVKLVEKTMYREHVYTADFKVVVDDEFINKYGDVLKIYGNHIFYVDVKGTYNKFGGDRIFPIHQKQLYHSYGLHVLKINPIKFFNVLGLAPKELMYMKNRKKLTLRKDFKSLIALEDYKNYEYRHSIKSNFGTDESVKFLPKFKLH